MPQVPYQGVPTARPEMPAPPREQITEQTPGAAFGTNIGAAVERLGTTFDQVGGELWNRAVQLQEMKNETESNEADAQYMIQAGERHAQFNALQGQARADAYPQYVQDMQDLRQHFRQNLSNDSSRRMFDRSSLSTMGRTIFNGAGVAAEGQRTALDASYNAQQDAIVNRAQSVPTTEADYQRDVDRLTEIERAKGVQRGDLPATTEDQIFKQRSRLTINWLSGVAKEQPFAAEKLYETYTGILTEADDKKIRTEIREITHTTSVRVEGDNINHDFLQGEDDGRTLGDRQAEARRRGAELAPKDPGFGKRLEDVVTQRYNQHLQDTRDIKYHNVSIVNAAINGAFGTVPTTDQDIRALDPKTRAAWDNLDPGEKVRLRHIMAQNAKGDVPFGEEALRRYQQLRGMANEDPSGFLDIDTAAEGKLPIGIRKQLGDIQLKIKQGAQGNPKVNEAMNSLAPFIPSTITQDKDERQQFKGALELVLEDFHTNNNRYPKPDELRVIGSRLVQERVTGNWFFDRTAPLYKFPVPQKLQDDVKERAKAAGQPVPTDEQIQQEYTRQQYQQMYPTPSKPTKPPTKPPGPGPAQSPGSILPGGENLL